MATPTPPQDSTQYSRQAWSVLIVSTLAFTVCFMVWMMFGVIGIPIKKTLDLNATEFGLLTAMPVLTGSLIRVPLGIWTDKYGGRIVMTLLMASTVPAIWLMSYATAYWHFLVIGLFVGLAGGSFSVGTPYVARWFLRHRQGMAMGIYGAGNSGAAVNKFVAPALVVAFGWTMVPKVYAVIMLVTVVLFWVFSYSDPAHLVPSHVKFTDQLKALKDPRVLKYCQYYSIVFGGYVALSLWMVQYYVGEYGLDIRIAALLAACFSLPGGVLRAFGGWLSDKFGAHSVTWWVMWVSWICLFLLSYPQTDMTIVTIDGPKTFHVGLNVYAFTALMFILGIAWAFGKASSLQVHQRRLPAEHRRDQRHRRPGGRPRRLRAADHVRCADGPDRHPLERLHADVRRGLGLADLDVLDRGPQDPNDGRARAAVPALTLVGALIFPLLPAGNPLHPQPKENLHGFSCDYALDPGRQGFLAVRRQHGRQRNLWISIPALMLAFAVWMVWSVVVVNLPNVGFKFSTNQLFWLAALPALCGATLRIFYSFMVPIFGGRRWTAISTASLLLPALGIGFAVQDPTTSYEVMVMLALLCGFGGGNFASSMANISFFFPKAQKGYALGLNAGLGNLGVSIVQFVVPLVITAGVFGTLGGEPAMVTKAGQQSPMWLQNAGFIWVPFIALSAIAAWFGMNDLADAKASFADQAVIFKRKHNWLMCWLYLGTFGSLHRLLGRLSAADQEPVPRHQPAAVRLARPAGRCADPSGRRLAVPTSSAARA